MAKARGVKDRALTVRSEDDALPTPQAILHSLIESHRTQAEKILEDRENWRRESKNTKLVVN